MNGREQKFLQCGRRTCDWGVANPGIIPPRVGAPERWAPITRQFDALEQIVKVLEDSAAEQQVMATRATLEATSEAHLRGVLRRELRAMTQVAQALRIQVPGISILRMPEARMSNESFIKAADALARDASAYEAVLIEHGRPADFIRRIYTGISALRGSIDARGAARAQQVVATKRVASALAQGKQCITIIDAFVSVALHDKPAELAGWKNVRRVMVKGVRGRTASEDIPTISLSEGSVTTSEVKAA